MAGRPEPRTLEASDVRVFHQSDLLDSLRQEAAYAQGGKNACTLARDPRMRTLLVAIQPGKRLDEHEAPAPVTISVLSGKIRLHAPSTGEARDLGPGDIAVMAANARHAVEGIEEAAFVVVIAGAKSGA